MLVTNGLWGINTALQTVILGHMTAAAIAANSVASTLYMLIKSTAVGASSTASVMIGKAVGSGDIPLTKHYSKLLQRLFLCIGVLSGITLFSSVSRSSRSTICSLPQRKWQILFSSS